MSKTTQTLADLAREAIEIQNACNLSGLLFRASEVMQRLRELLPGLSTSDYNRHPIMIMWTQKMADLSYYGEPELFSTAYSACRVMCET